MITFSHTEYGSIRLMKWTLRITMDYDGVCRLRMYTELFYMMRDVNETMENRTHVYV